MCKIAAKESVVRPNWSHMFILPPNFFKSYISNSSIIIINVVILDIDIFILLVL